MNKKNQKFKSHQCILALCPKARNSIKVGFRFQRNQTTSAFKEFLGIRPFISSAGPLMAQANTLSCLWQDKIGITMQLFGGLVGSTILLGTK